MELNSEVITTPPRAAATVVMLRDAARGLEVFLLKRHGLSDVLGGAYVFPGGKVDAHDAELDMTVRLDQSPQQLHAGLNEPDIDAVTAASLYVAALREAFEESGVLFAQDASAARATQAGALLREGCDFDEVLARMALRLQTRSVVPWSRWITPRVPSVMNKRFDTRFFVSAVPLDQIARHDNHETTESVWLRPRAALEQYRDGQIELAPPQIMSLAHLSHHSTVDSVLQEARARRPPIIQPESFEQDGSRVVCYPGDERHSLRERALPGPTRLRYRNRRFEPLEGFEALFA
ncbi:MAG: NUDIX hydrolase [Rhodoferax sp.]|nr:NUDIX hydrolase [Rhodoferax sp.]